MSTDLEDLTNAWLGVAGSQIFLMQLGFLCYEIGFVNPVWTSSIIVKNMQDTFVGIMTFLCFTYTFGMSELSLFGIIGAPDHIFLRGVEKSRYGFLFVSACFATTCATIISGAVLQRLKNKGYITWCFLVVCVNYSFISHWVWNKQGWLNKMGFIDCAGGLVVHATGGLAGCVANYYLGPQKSSVDPKTRKLKKAKRAHQPVLIAIGVFMLWYGWFAFNLTSPFIAGVDIGGNFGTIALAIIVAPTAASVSALLIMKFFFNQILIEDLVTCILAALVAASGCCYTVQYLWSVFCIGTLASPVFFITNRLIRNRLLIDDPLAVGSTHFFPGIYGCFMEGLFANTAGSTGLFYGGYHHFGIQVLGITVVTIFNCLVSMALWKLMVNGIWRRSNLRVTALDTYLGTKLFHLKPTLAFDEMLSLQSNTGKQVLLHYHKFCVERLCDEELDFLVAVMILRDIERYLPEVIAAADGDVKQVMNDAILQVTETFVLPNAPKCINISTPARAMAMRIHEDLKLNVALVDRNVFDSAYGEVFKIMMEPLRKFLTTFQKSKHTVRWRIRVPFQLSKKWEVVWDDDYERTKTRSRSVPSSLAFDDQITYHPDLDAPQLEAQRSRSAGRTAVKQRHKGSNSANALPKQRTSMKNNRSTNSRQGLLRIRAPSNTPTNRPALVQGAGNSSMRSVGDSIDGTGGDPLGGGGYDSDPISHNSSIVRNNTARNAGDKSKSKTVGLEPTPEPNPQPTVSPKEETKPMPEPFSGVVSPPKTGAATQPQSLENAGSDDIETPVPKEVTEHAFSEQVRP